MQNTQDTFQQLGGIEGCRSLAAAFYRRVAGEPVLRPMYPGHLGCPTESLALFFAYLVGGDSGYILRHGEPRLRHSHLRFRIGQAERDAWVLHITAAVDEADIPESLRPHLKRCFEEAATFLINQPATPRPLGNNSPPAIDKDERPDRDVSPPELGVGGLKQSPGLGVGGPPLPLEQAWARVCAIEEMYDAAAAGDEAKIQAMSGKDLASPENLLLHAAGHGQMGILRRLLDAGADARKVVVSGLMLEQNPEAADLLLAHGASVNGFPGRRPPLVEAARGDKGEHPARIQLLLDHGADVNAVTPGGQTALHYAARAGSLRVMEILINHGANLNIQDKDGAVPLLYAVQRGKREAAARLLAAGANPNARLTKSGQAPLHFAAQKNDPEMVEMLLNHGADPGERDHRGQTPLEYAVEHNLEVMAELLRSHKSIGSPAQGH